MNDLSSILAQGDVAGLTVILRSQIIKNYNKIPDVLKEQKSWLLWRITKIDQARGKFDKVPHYPRSKRRRSGRQGADQDLKNLGTWEEVWRAFNHDSSFAGVGLAMLPGSEITALDADNVIFSKMEKNIVNEELQNLCSQTYSELSPSGKGIRAFWRGSARDRKNHLAGIEIFHQSGFVTVTGNCLHNREPEKLSTEVNDALEQLIGSEQKQIRDHFPLSSAAPPILPIIMEELTAALEIIPSDDRELWIKIGHALKTLGERAKPIWHEWSRKSDKYDYKDAEYTWVSLKPIRSGYEAIAAEARRRGWQGCRSSGLLPAPGPAPEDQSLKVHKMPKPFCGVMADVVDAALATAFKPQPNLTILATLIAMAAACDGNYRLPSGTRLNLYGLGVGATGTGKDHTRFVAEMIGKEVGAIRIGEAGSSQGLEDALQNRRALLSIIDEIAFTLAAVTDPASPAHLKSVAGVFLKLFSAGRGYYSGRALAGKPSIVVEHPCFNLLGFATPEKLGDALKHGSISDGLVGRMLMAVAFDGVSPSRKEKPFHPPISMKEKAQELVNARLALATSGNSEIEILLASGVSEALDHLINEFDQEQQTSKSEVDKILLVRSYEKVERIAGVLAVWETPLKPIITADCIDWAVNFVRSSNAEIRRFVGAHIHAGKSQADAAAVRRTINKILNGELKTDRTSEREAIKMGYAPMAFALKRSKLDKKEFDNAIQYLVACEELVSPFDYGNRGRQIRVTCFTEFS